jgi:hypothetical protein
VLLAAGLAIKLLAPASADYDSYAAGCIRIGAILAVVWLALPDTQSLRNRIGLGVVLVLATVLVLRPSLLKYLFWPAALAALIFILLRRPAALRRKPRR